MELQLKKSTETSVKGENNLTRSLRTTVDIESIKNYGDQTVVLVVVKDVNDNAPKFKDGSTLTIGYPVQNLTKYVNAQYLAKVTATDEDEGINAVIKYSLDVDNFYIHKDTGVIYPNADIYQDNLSFDVKATDKDGEGMTSKLKINVRIKENFTVQL